MRCAMKLGSGLPCFIRRASSSTRAAMKRLLPIALAAFLPLSALAVTGDKAEFRKIAEDVYAFVGKRNDANAMVVVTAQGVVLVDTGNNPPETRLLQNFIKSVTSQPVRYVI